MKERRASLQVVSKPPSGRDSGIVTQFLSGAVFRTQFTVLDHGVRCAAAVFHLPPVRPGVPLIPTFVKCLVTNSSNLWPSDV